jgi:predicted permease
MIWIIFIASIPFFILLQHKIKFERKTTGALILTAGLANTSFVGFPVLIALFGEEGLKIGVVIDQAGSFLVLSTLGIIVASLYSKGTYSVKKITRDVITYPSFIAFLISIIMIVFSIKHNDVSLSILNKLGSPTIILALISIGMQIKINVKEIIWKELSTGLLYKLFLAPAIIYILFIYVLRQDGLSFEGSIMEAAMPPMVMGSVLANKFGLNPKLANLMVGIGIPVSAITLAIWFLIIKL